MASAFCFATASAALVIGRAEFQRPSYDQMLNWLIVTMPMAGYLWVESRNTSGLTMELLRIAPARAIPFPILVVFGLSALMAGIRQRVHAPLLAFLMCAACVGYELRHLTTLSIQGKLIGWGSLVFLMMLGLNRYLRTPRCGITSQRFDENDGSFDLVQLAGASAIASPAVQPPGAQFKDGGGAGGGGGASQGY
jgi:uncharacterized membrane protein YgcG